MTKYVLEPPAAQFADAAAQSRRSSASPRGGAGHPGRRPVGSHRETRRRRRLDDGVKARIRIVKPVGTSGPMPVVLYLHGGGWVLGSAATHDRLVRELSVGAHCAVVFIDYDRAPEVRYPGRARARVCRRALDVSTRRRRGPGRHPPCGGWRLGRRKSCGRAHHLGPARGDVRFVHRSLYYPVTSAAQNSHSYSEFANGPHLTAKAMAWFWDAYLPDRAAPADALASPLVASIDELAGLPEAFVVTCELDVLRDEGEAYACKLVAAAHPSEMYCTGPFDQEASDD